MFYSGQHGQLYIKSAGSGSLATGWQPEKLVDQLCNERAGHNLLGRYRPNVAATVCAALVVSRHCCITKRTTATSDLMAKDLIYGKSTSGSSYTATKDLWQNNPEPELSNIVLRLWDGNTRDLSVVAFVTGFTMSCAVGEVVTAEFTFEGHGAPMDMDMIT